MADIEKAIEWFRYRLNGTPHSVDYSMANRNGEWSYDCSSSVYYALIEAGFLPEGTWIGNTESLFNDLEKNGWQKLPRNADGSVNVERGDIFIWGTRGASGGAFGHTGIFETGTNDPDPEIIIHCNYANNGISESYHDDFWALAGYPETAFYRPPAPAQRPEVAQVESRPVNGMSMDELKEALKQALREGVGV